jgi:hypothetical protein
MKTNFHKQKGSVGLFFLVLGMIMVTSLVQVLRTAARKAELGRCHQWPRDYFKRLQ